MKNIPVSKDKLRVACIPYGHSPVRLTYSAQLKFYTVMILNDQGIHCLLFHFHILTKYAKVWPIC